MTDECDRAIADFTDAVPLDPNHALVYQWRGDSYSDKGEYTKVIDDFTEAIRLEPTSSGYYDSRAVAFRAIGERQEA